MNSSSWEIQEDRFDDVESEMDEKLSVYEDDLYIDDPGIMEHEKLNEVTITNHSPPRLSTIAEESNIVAEGNEIGARKATYVDSIFGPGLRGKLSGENEDVVERTLNMLQHDQESFCKQQQRIHDDFGVNRPCLEKENSWEPSIHSSLPPSPKICISELAAFNSHLIPTTLSTARKETSQDIESTPPGISSHMRRLKKKNEPKQNFGGPKMSTPKSAETSLRALSINCISSIYPETISPQSIRGMNLKSSGPFPMARRMSMVTEEPSLSSSAIDRVLEKENFDNDDALVEALLQAKTRPRLKLNFPEVIVGKRPETDEQMERSLRRYEGSTDDSNANGHNQMKNVTTRYDRSGITNETKKLKTVRELNLLREISNTAEDLSPSAKTNSLRHIDAENQGKFLSCDQSFVYFGFVDVKCRVNRSVRLRNISSKSLNLKLQLHSMSRGYDLLEQDIIVLKPQEIHLVHVIFQPPFGACFQNTLTIRVLNAEHINYSIPLLGSGGVAALRILTQSGLTMLRDGSFVLTAQGVTNISFDVENRGLRDAFVRVVVVNKETKETISGCTIAPSDCVSILHRSKQKFSIEVPSLCGEESNGNSNPSFPFSSLSMPLVAGNTQYYVQLLWGEEAQRRRLKRYENMKCANFAFNGLTFTKCKFINEKECKSTASEDAFYGPYDRDAFELGLRITLISVVDNRLSLLSRNSCLPHKEMYTESVILEPNAALSPRDGNKSVVEDVSTIFTASRVL
uniref:Cep192/Spd-2-like domain-containing protein n=1 Tax=Wuchereria bancrofti TaxID=6293 RepID=A0A1I8EDS2_WUCBA